MAGFDLNGKSLVVIGGTTGLGLSAARAFVKCGARVIDVARNPQNGRAAQRKLRKAATSSAAGATASDTAPRAISLAMDAFDGFRGLYHVAGGSGRAHGDG